MPGFVIQKVWILNVHRGSESYWKKLLKKHRKANVITLNNIVNKVMPQISTNLSTANMLGLAAHAADYKLGRDVRIPV